MSGDRFLLLGDAASLIDPFSGEGIGNGIRSGRLAAEVVKEALISDNFSAKFLKKYDRMVKDKMGLEFLRSKQLQTISTYTRLFDFIAKRFQSSLYLQKFLEDLLANVHQRKFIIHPTFLYHLFLKGIFKKS
jgi:flavin-dependent dehydrogenase